jgi:hypothetical protein
MKWWSEPTEPSGSLTLKEVVYDGGGSERGVVS